MLRVLQTLTSNEFVGKEVRRRLKKAAHVGRKVTVVTVITIVIIVITIVIIVITIMAVAIVIFVIVLKIVTIFVINVVLQILKNMKSMTTSCGIKGQPLSPPLHFHPHCHHSWDQADML